MVFLIFPEVIFRKLVKELFFSRGNKHILYFAIAEITSQGVQLLQVDKRENPTIQLHLLSIFHIKMMFATLLIIIHIHIQLYR